MSKHQYGFTPQTSTIDIVMDLKDFLQDSLNDEQYVALIILYVNGDFDVAWLPSIVTSLKTLKSPRNLYKFCLS